MDVKDFVSETLKQVTEAIKENDSTLICGIVDITDLKKMNMFSYDRGFVTHVDFDIAVTESAVKEGGAKLSIAGVGSLGGDLSNVICDREFLSLCGLAYYLE